MTIDRRESYYIRSAFYRAVDPLEFQRRYFAGIAVLTEMIRIDKRKRLAKQGAVLADNVRPLRRKLP